MQVLKSDVRQRGPRPPIRALWQAQLRHALRQGGPQEGRLRLKLLQQRPGQARFGGGLGAAVQPVAGLLALDDLVCVCSPQHILLPRLQFHATQLTSLVAFVRVPHGQ